MKLIAENKVRDAKRKYLLSSGHDIRRDVSLETLTPEEEENLISRDLSPEEAYMLKELVEERLEDFIDQLPEMVQTIVRLLLKGAMGDDIAQRLGVEWSSRNWAYMELTQTRASFCFSARNCYGSFGPRAPIADEADCDVSRNVVEHVIAAMACPRADHRPRIKTSFPGRLGVSGDG